MDDVKSLYDVTKRMEKLLIDPIASEDRSDVIEKMNDLAEERDLYFKKIKPPFSEEEKRVGKKIILLNEHVQKQMALLFHELKEEMSQVNKQRKSNNSYTNPYEHIKSMDGMFLDSKY